MKKLGGVIVPVAVPLDAGGRPDPEAYGAFIQSLLGAGVHGIFANGSMGAFALLRDEQQDLLIRTAVQAVGGAAPVLAGVSDTSPSRVLRRIERIAELPLDALVVMPPYFYLAGQAELIRFFEEIASASPLPILLYDNPRLTKNQLSPATVKHLAAHGNVKGIKASSPDMDWCRELLESGIDRDGFSLISGAGRQSSAALRLGFDGITEGLHNIVPHLAVQLWNAARAGQFEQADEAQAAINECFGIFDEAGGWRGLEIAFEWMGVSPRAALPPYDLPISDGSRRAITGLLEKYAVASRLALSDRR